MDRGKLRRIQLYRKTYRQLKNGNSGKNSLPQRKVPVHTKTYETTIKNKRL